jgi:hypothetical protein
MLVTSIQSIAAGMRMKMYSPVGDQKPSRAQFVERSRKHLSAIAVVVRDQLVRRVSDLRGLASDDERGHRENDESGSCGSSPTLPVDCCHRQASS